MTEISAVLALLLAAFSVICLLATVGGDAIKDLGWLGAAIIALTFAGTFVVFFLGLEVTLAFL